MIRLSLLLTVLCAPIAAQHDIALQLDNHCIDCHSAPEPAGGLDLENWLEQPPSVDWTAQLLDLDRRVREGTMPPPGAADPLEAEGRTAMLAWMDQKLDQTLPKLEIAPGRVTVRRLSREEYRRTISALFGVDIDVAQRLPADDLGYGFDNVGDALSVSLLHLEKYAEVAGMVAEQVLLREDPDNPAVRRVEAEGMGRSNDRIRLGDFAGLSSNGTVTSTFKLPRAGRYRIRVAAAATQAGPEIAKMRVAFGEERLGEFEVEGTRRKPSVFEWEVRAEEGRRSVDVSFINDYYNPKAKDPSQRDRNMYVDWCEIVGPLDPYVPPRQSLWVLEGDAGRGRADRRARPLLATLLSRAWRRPATSSEVTRMARLVRQTVDDGGSFADGFRLAFEATLVSPNFIFRMEPGALRSRGDEAVDLDDWALASRLSYFLWSAPPDEQLAAAAKKGTLGQPSVLHEQVKRLLRDPRAEALASNFGAQWLELRNLSTLTPDPERFPTWNVSLAEAMRGESEQLVLAVLRENLDVRDLLRADFTFVDDTLAKHYGLPTTQGEPGWRRVSLPEGRAPGLIGHASLHALTSNPTRTSPVKRGKWLLENLLDAAPPPPPPGSDSLGDEEAIDSAQSLRESLARHRADVDCAGCHVRMDGLGLALEGFDPVGRMRETDGGQPIDTRGEVPGGLTIDGATELAALLADDPAFIRCILKKLFVHGVGRAPTADDRVAIERLRRSLPKDRITLEMMVLGIIDLDAFHRRDPARRSR